MKGGIFFTGTGRMVLVTTYNSFTEASFAKNLRAKGLKKFIAYEVPMDELKQKYGEHYRVIMNDLHQTDDLRVLDFDGQRIFKNFALGKLGQPVYYEP